MKILYHHRIASNDGQYVHLQELVTALRKQGHEVLVVGPDAVHRHTFGSSGGAVSRMKATLPSAFYELLEMGYSVVALWRLWRAARRFGPDVMYERYNLFFPIGVWYARTFGLPLLLEVNAPLFDERNRFGGIALKRLARWSERYTWRNADGVLPVTRVLAKQVAAEGVPEERLHVIPNGIDPERFSAVGDAEVAKKALGLEGRVVIGFTGFMREWHGLDRLLELLGPGQARNNYLLLVGDGPARGKLERLARKQGVEERMTTTGVVSRDQIAQYVAAFDIAVQPDVVDYASPLKLFEYLALGRAIVAPDRPNIREILENGRNALLFAPNEPKELVEKVEALTRDPGLRVRLGDQAKMTIGERNLTWEGNAQRVVRLFEELRQEVAAERSTSYER